MFLLLPLACTSAPEPSPTPLPAPASLPRTEAEVFAAAEAFNADRPLYERPVGDGRTGVEGLADLSATTCAGCHAEIAAEWHTSVHAVAWIDPQFQGEITKSDNRWLCLNCHTPLQIQQPQLAIGLHDDDVERPILVDNPSYDAALREEGITCAACHVRDGIVHGPGLGGSPPHPVKADPSYRSGAMCMRCHQAEATYPGKNFVCTFNTGEEWRAGPYDEEGITCVTCHMPTISRPAATGGPVREVRRHWWRGSGIPKIPGRYPPPEANKPGLEMRGELTGDRLTVTAVNKNAGHMLPTGDPERRVHIDALFQDASGAEVGSTRWTFGQVWTWSPPTKHSDDRLAPRESRTLTAPLPEGTTTVVLQATSERMSEENAEYHDLDGYPITVTYGRTELTVPNAPASSPSME